MQNVFEKIKEKLKEKIKTQLLCAEGVKENDKEIYCKYYGNAHGLKMAIEIINQVAEEYNNSWIPVEERLPKTNGCYLTCDKLGNIHLFSFDGELFRDNYSHPITVNHERFYQPVAWQPLPPAYKPKEEVSHEV